ncbi:unnamed protein product [Alternaria alternata]
MEIENGHSRVRYGLGADLWEMLRYGPADAQSTLSPHKTTGSQRQSRKLEMRERSDRSVTACLLQRVTQQTQASTEISTAKDARKYLTAQWAEAPIDFWKITGNGAATFFDITNTCDAVSFSRM